MYLSFVMKLFFFTSLVVYFLLFLKETPFILLLEIHSMKLEGQLHFQALSTEAAHIIFFFIDWRFDL